MGRKSMRNGHTLLHEAGLPWDVHVSCRMAVVIRWPRVRDMGTGHVLAKGFDHGLNSPQLNNGPDQGL